MGWIVCKSLSVSSNLPYSEEQKEFFVFCGSHWKPEPRISMGTKEERKNEATLQIAE